MQELRNNNMALGRLQMLVSSIKYIAYYKENYDEAALKIVTENEKIFHEMFSETNIDTLKRLREMDLKEIFKEDLNLALDILDSYIMIIESRDNNGKSNTR